MMIWKMMVTTVMMIYICYDEVSLRHENEHFQFARAERLPASFGLVVMMMTIITTMMTMTMVMEMVMVMRT